MNVIWGKDGEDVGMRFEYFFKFVEVVFEFLICVVC